METKIKSVKEFRDGQELHIIAVAMTERTFKDRKTGQEETKKLLIFKTDNKGKIEYYSTNEGTTIYKQTMAHFDALEFVLEVNKSVLLSETVHIDVKRSASNPYDYQSIKEWTTAIDTEKLFGD